MEQNPYKAPIEPVEIEEPVEPKPPFSREKYWLTVAGLVVLVIVLMLMFLVIA